MPNLPEPIVGIDLGTTNSLVAIANWPPNAPADQAAPRILPDAQGRPMLPSVVRFDGAGRPVELGYEARRSALAHPLRTISSVKRLMGRSLRDAAPDLPYLSFRIVEGPQNTARIALPIDSSTDNSASIPRSHDPSIPPKIISPQEVSAIILRALREQAERALGVPISRSVITVPAWFDDAQRQATRDAGRLAGLDVVRIINEPTAAALAYGLGLRESAGAITNPTVVAVYDLGGGTFDISILRITPREWDLEIKGSRDQGLDPTPLDPTIPRSLDPIPPDVFHVLSTAGDTRLGGDDFDNALVDVFLREIAAQLGIPRESLDLPPETLQALRQFAEAAKVRLSSQEHAALRIDLGQGRVYQRTLTRAEFESLIAPLVDRTLAACNRALRDARRQMEGESLAAVILVGGATRTPLVRAKVEEFFGIKPYTALNPDEVVALGAAVQASVLARTAAGDTAGAQSLLLDVVPLSLGLETVGGAMAKLIMRNSTVPARASERFSTSVDNQTAIQLNILQGERELAADCRTLARLELKGIPPMPAGIPRLVVEFLVDASGILTVQAAEERSGRRLEAQVVPNHGLTREEVDRIERESFAHARDDMQRHRVIDLVANARMDVGWIEKQLQQHGARLEPAEQQNLTFQVSSLKSQIAAAERDWTSVNPDALHAAKESLARASLRLQEIAIAESLRG